MYTMTTTDVVKTTTNVTKICKTKFSSQNNFEVKNFNMKNNHAFVKPQHTQNFALADLATMATSATYIASSSNN